MQYLQYVIKRILSALMFAQSNRMVSHKIFILISWKKLHIMVYIFILFALVQCETIASLEFVLYTALNVKCLVHNRQGKLQSLWGNLADNSTYIKRTNKSRHKSSLYASFYIPCCSSLFFVFFAKMQSSDKKNKFFLKCEFSLRETN